MLTVTSSQVLQYTVRVNEVFILRSNLVFKFVPVAMYGQNVESVEVAKLLL